MGSQKQIWTDEVFRILEIDLEYDAPEIPEGLNFIDPEFRPMAEKGIQGAMEKGEPYNQEWIVTTAKRQKKWVNAVCNPIMENGELKSVSGSFQDITDRKNAEEQLKVLNQQLGANEQQLRAANQQLQASEQQLQASVQQLQASEQQLRAASQELLAAKEKAEESEIRYRNLVDTASDAIYLISEDGTLIDTNQGAIEMLGKARDEIVGQSIVSVDPSYPVKKFLDYWKDVPFDKQLRFETAHQHKNGNLIPVD